jgi:hypothetical protein
MTTPPRLDPDAPAFPIQPGYALLINPFYPKDANPSFGKHVLTPTLALTSFAATTPAHWRVQYWDENLLRGCPPYAPLPQIVGITVHGVVPHARRESSPGWIARFVCCGRRMRYGIRKPAVAR